MLPAPAAEPMPAPRAAPRRWFLADVVVPFAASRALLLLAAWYATQFAPSWTYFLPVAATRGWTYVDLLPIDVWGRYDTVWYLDLAWNGYRLPAGPEWQSNLAFFPLFPLLVRGAYALVPSAWHGFAALYVCAVVVANAAALAGLAAVHAWVRAAFGDAALARWVVILVVAFPGGLFLSCAYSESVFLLVSAASLLAAERGRPLAAGAAGLLAALARPTGVLLAAPILVAAWKRSTGVTTGAARWPGLVGAALPGVGLALHAANLWRVSGDPLAFLHVQASWGRGLAAPWAFLLDRPGLHPWTAPLDRAAILLFLGLAILLLARERRAGAGTYVLLSLVPMVLSGTPMSATRLVAVLFPALVPLARLAGRGPLGAGIVAALAVVQALLFVAWSRFHWVA
jgi:hypothetical protein